MDNNGDVVTPELRKVLDALDKSGDLQEWWRTNERERMVVVFTDDVAVMLTATVVAMPENHPGDDNLYPQTGV